VEAAKRPTKNRHFLIEDISNLKEHKLFFPATLNNFSSLGLSINATPKRTRLSARKKNLCSSDAVTKPDEETKIRDAAKRKRKPRFQTRGARL